MYEEVCLICGRPVLADGRPYCSDQCESTDVTSPSVSTTSSAQPSPFLNSTANVPGALAEVPALLPSTLGRSFKEAHQTHRVRHSVSSSSNSSVSWSALEEDYEEESVNPALYSAGTDEEFGVHPDYLSAEAGSSKPSSSYGNVYRNTNSSLAYVRRPSTTNNRSMIPTLHHRTSSASTPSSNGISQSVPYYCSTEDDASDVPSASASSISGRSGRRLGRKSTDSVAQITDESEREKDDTVTAKNRRNRASLPAYFSLLTSTSPAGSRSQKSLSSLQTLSMISRSLQSSSSPPTPRLAKPVVDTTTAFATAQMGRVTKPHIVTADAAPRGRSRQRDPDGRSSSSRRSASRSPGARAHAHHNAHARARLDSMEKVADWVAHSPVVAASVRIARQQVQHHPHHRRNSSPPPLPKFEKSRPDSGVDLNIGYINTAVEEFDEEDECEEPEQERGSRRGRRRTDELDKLPPCVDRSAPGYGNGRSGLMARERSRGRTVTLKR